MSLEQVEQDLTAAEAAITPQIDEDMLAESRDRIPCAMSERSMGLSGSISLNSRFRSTLFRKLSTSRTNTRLSLSRRTIWPDCFTFAV